MRINDLYENNDWLEDQARMVQFDNVNSGEEGHHPPEDTEWRYATVPLSKFVHVLGEVSEWKEWYQNEIDMHDEDGNDGVASFYRDLIKNPIDEYPIVLHKNGKFHIWDGYHRVGAAFVRGDDRIKVILGEPK